MAIARFPVVVLDCPDPKALAEFYGALLGWEVQRGDGDSAGDSGGDSDDGTWWQIRAD
ncbi:MAG TPA: VOC family protein, partial [Dermatophilaceae bacterium]|nr:VOC family protein [Dermatophilaceae bacterium]HPZ69399.1 VOC family protein [Dermatophilaceae bacterium]